MRGVFYDVLTQAVNDLTKHGFDSEERLQGWLTRLEQAARDNLIPEEVLRRQLRDALSRVFERQTRLSALGKTHLGITRYTLQRVKPRLRDELDRRILASANLITLNRDASIQRTLQRFAGWASSIPVGGTEVAERQEAKNNIRRGIAGLPFEERRVVIDQGHKLSASISEIVAKDGGAIAGEWHHVMEGGGYQARPEHVARNGHIYVLRDNWALRAGYMKLAGRQYYDEITAAAQEPFCRCWITWLHNLRDLPADMLTEKGRERLVQVRAQAA